MADNKYVGEWRPHRPIGPIMAHFQSPGPKYLIPGSTGYKDHDARKIKMPAYSFGGRLKPLSNENFSPGPIYKVPALMTRFGKDGAPVYTLKSRMKSLSQSKFPGPGTYSPERSGKAAYRSPPCYTLHGRTNLAKADYSPGPSAYSLPDLSKSMEKPPHYSMLGRSYTGSFLQDLSRSPGPATYHITPPTIYKRRDPIYSMTGRNHPPDARLRIPGPGAHQPEKVYEIGKYTPKYSFGIRHTPYAGLPRTDFDNC